LVSGEVTCFLKLWFIVFLTVKTELGQNGVLGN
jgi:hypothetical protein